MNLEFLTFSSAPKILASRTCSALTNFSSSSSYRFYSARLRWRCLLCLAARDSCNIEVIYAFLADSKASFYLLRSSATFCAFYLFSSSRMSSTICILSSFSSYSSYATAIFSASLLVYSILRCIFTSSESSSFILLSIIPA